MKWKGSRRCRRSKSPASAPFRKPKTFCRRQKSPLQELSGGICPPAWWQRGEASGFLGGIGGPAESRESAEAQARLDIAKSIEVGISGTDTIQQRETSEKGFEYSVESTIVERVNLSLAGISIPNVGKCGNQWYAHARLNRAQAENAWRSDLQGLDAEAETLRTFIGGKINKQRRVCAAVGPVSVGACPGNREPDRKTAAASDRQTRTRITGPRRRDGCPARL